MTTEELQVIEEMERAGGSFVHGLALAARRADPGNMRRIKNAFADYWEIYRHRAMKRRGEA